MEIYRWLPHDAAQLLLVLFLSFLIGLEREEHKTAGAPFSFGGVRTFPLIGLIGYSIALLSGSQLLPVTIGFLVVGSFLLLSYWHKLSRAEAPGVTSEMSALATYLVGALICYQHVLDCHRSHRCECSAARAEDRSRIARHSGAARRISYVREISAPDGGHSSHVAQSGVWPLSHQSL